MIKTGSNNVATELYIPASVGQEMICDGVAIQLLSADLNQDTTVTLQFSLDRTNWDNATNDSGDITDILKKDEPKVVVYDLKPLTYWRLAITAGSTGTVNYIIHD